MKKDIENIIIEEATKKTIMWQERCKREGVYKTSDEILNYYEDMKRILSKKYKMKEKIQK